MATLSSHGFGDLLRRHRLAAGLTQEELAAQAGLSVRGLSDLERGVPRAERPSSCSLRRSTSLRLSGPDWRQLPASGRPQRSRLGSGG
jgi:transcriptional regulator with XRE-family HTH domain